MMRAEPIGIYVHIPFCVRKCNYCDFCSYPVDTIQNRVGYIRKIISEISIYKDRNIRVDSIFFGGGTPSLLSADEMAEIVSALRETFVIDDDCEFTVEVNPKTVTRESLRAFLSLGVNRLSMGLQSVHENELKTLGRIHNFDDFVESYNFARSSGFTNVNVDLMFGLPDQSKESFLESLKKVVSLSPEHVSVYGLILEEGTRFYDIKDSLKLPSEDEECEMYYLAADFLRNAGYHHYEISNYSRSGKESRHNLKYWRNKNYLGFGVSAYSYFDSKRFGNCSDISLYLQHENTVAYSELICKDEQMYEYVMLGLRLSDGISLSDYKEKFSCDFLSGREEVISKFTECGYLKIENGRLFLTEAGFYLSNSILCELI